MTVSGPNPIQLMALDFLGEETRRDRWTSSWEMARLLSAVGVTSKRSYGVYPASADTASRYLSGLLKLGLVERERQLGEMRAVHKQAKCNCWRLSPEGREALGLEPLAA
jgi:hypothetical protein